MFKVSLIVFPYSVELRELEAKLKAGYMNQERAAQLAEKMAMAMDRQVRNYFTNQASVKVNLSSRSDTTLCNTTRSTGSRYLHS